MGRKYSPAAYNAIISPALEEIGRSKFWVPEPDEIDDHEGFGMFQDVWPVTEVSADEANGVAREDGLLCQVVGGLARDAADFDVLAAAAETGNQGSVCGRHLAPGPRRARLA